MCSFSGGENIIGTTTLSCVEQSAAVSMSMFVASLQAYQPIEPFFLLFMNIWTVSKYGM